MLFITVFPGTLDESEEHGIREGRVHMLDFRLGSSRVIYTTRGQWVRQETGIICVVLTGESGVRNSNFSCNHL